MTLELDYQIVQPDLCEHPQVVVVFMRDGVHDVCRVMARHLRFDATTCASGTVAIEFEHLPLGVGRYTVTVMVAKEGYYDGEPKMFYSLNPDVYVCHSNLLEIVVEGGGQIASGTGLVLDGTWSMSPAGCRLQKTENDAHTEVGNA